MADRMTYRAQARAVLGLGLPLIGSNLAQFSLNVTDTVMLGWYSVQALAAVTLGASTFFIIFIVGAGFAIAVMPMVAEAAAGDNAAEARRVTRMGLWLSILYAGAAMPLMWYSGPILRALGQQPQVAALTQDYLRIAGWGLMPALLVMVLKSFLAALERTRVVLMITLAGVLLNALIDWLLIFGQWGLPELGVRGAACATFGTQVLTVALTAAYASIQSELRPYQLFVRFWRADWPAFVQVFRLGWPIGLTSLAEGGLFNASALMMGWIGTVQLAAHGIALEIVALTFMVHLGLSNAATVRAGRARGARDARSLRDGAAVAIALSAVFALIAVAAILGLPHTLLGLFVNPDDPLKPQILAFGTRLLLVAALFQFADAAQVMALGLLRGVQDTRVPMIMAAVSYWLIGIPASYLLAFPLGFGGTGLWFGLFLGLCLAALLMMTRFWRRAPRPAPVPPSPMPGRSAARRRPPEGPRPGAECAPPRRPYRRSPPAAPGQRSGGAPTAAGLLARLPRRRHQPVRLLAHQHRAQVVHRQQQRVGHRLQLRVGRLRLRPLGGKVQVIDRPVDVVDVALRQQRRPRRHPVADRASSRPGSASRSPCGLTSPLLTLTTAIWSISIRRWRFSVSTRNTAAPFSRTRK